MTKVYTVMLRTSKAKTSITFSTSQVGSHKEAAEKGFHSESHTKEETRRMYC